MCRTGTTPMEPRSADPLPGPSEFRRIIRRLNREQPKPRPVCERCRWPFAREERHDVFPALCWSCGQSKLDRLIRRIVQCLGRRRTLRTLRRLAK
jgi:hypothetical protein